MGVLEALYENSETLTLGFVSVNSQYVDTLSKAIASPGIKPKRAILRLHLTFLTNHGLPNMDASLKADVFERIIIPFLLFSKPRQHTAELIWESLAEREKSLSFELLKGTAVIWTKERSSERSPENMANLNVALTSKIAGQDS